MVKKLARKTVTKKRTTVHALPSSHVSFMDTLKLSSVRLLESHCKLSIADSQLPKKMNVSADVQIGIGDERKLLGNVIATVRSPEGEASRVEIMLDFQCVFDALSTIPAINNLSRDDSAALSSTVMFVAWPYVRMHVQLITSSMGLPPFTVPLIDPRTINLQLRRE